MRLLPLTLPLLTGLLALEACQQTSTHPAGLTDPGKPNPGIGGGGPPAQDAAPPEAGPTSGIITATPSAPLSIAVDATFLYWTTTTTVYRVPREGGTPVELAGSQNGAVGITERNGASLLWANGSTTQSGTIESYDLGSQSLSPLAQALGVPENLATDAVHAFWTTDTGGGVNVESVSLLGGPVNEVSSVSGGFTPAGLAIDASSAYFGVTSGGAGGAIYRTPLAGGGPEPLWSSPTVGPGQLVLLGTRLYWTVPAAAPSGAILSLPTTGGAVTTVVSGLDAPAALATDGARIYWSSPNAGTVSAAQPDGSQAVNLATGLTSPGVILVSDAVYVGTPSTIVAVPK